MSVSEDCRFLDDMRTVSVFWVFRNLEKLDCEPCEIFTSLTPETFGVRSVAILVESLLFGGGKGKNRL